MAGDGPSLPKRSHWQGEGNPYFVLPLIKAWANASLRVPGCYCCRMHRAGIRSSKLGRGEGQVSRPKYAFARPAC